MGNLLDSLFPEEGQLARLRAAVTGQGATPERLFATAQEPDRFAGAPVGNSSVYPQERVSVPTGTLLSPLEAKLASFKQSPVTNALMDAATPLGTIAGVGAKLLDHAALSRAKQLETSGALPETIWKATGFHRDKAGNWLWEIDDSGMQIKAYTHRGDTRGAYPEKDPPGFYGNHPGGDVNKNGYLFTHFPKDTKVGNVIDHPELFANYPHLAELPLQSNPFNFGLNGAYDPVGKKVTLNAGMPDKIPDVAVHELSHGVQHFEELPFGGNPGQYLPADFNAKKTFANEQIKMAREQMRDQLGHRVPEDELRQIENIAKVQAMGGKMPKSWQEKLVNFANNHSQLYSDLEQAIAEETKLTAMGNEAYNKYRALHGEQTANAAGMRVNLSPNQRRDRPFWMDYTLPESNHLMGNVEFWTP